MLTDWISWYSVKTSKVFLQCELPGDAFNGLLKYKSFHTRSTCNSLTPVCVFWCSCKYCRHEKLFPHTEHECGFSFTWTFKCVFRADAAKHVFPHWSHVNGFSPVWTHVWISRLRFSEKLVPHWSHAYGFSPVWILVCPLSRDYSVKLFPHWSHLNGLSTLRAGERLLGSCFL